VLSLLAINALVSQNGKAKKVFCMLGFHATEYVVTVQQQFKQTHGINPPS